MRKRSSVKFPSVTAIHATDRALLCVIYGQEFWVPFSQIDDDSQVIEQGDEGELVVTRWWAQQSGAISARAPVMCAKLEKASKTYRKLMFEFHPDRNPAGADTARALNDLWSAVEEDLKKIME